MKNRQSKEVRETQELFRQFRELKAKLVRQVEQHKLSLPQLEGFRELELQFVLDLNLLSVDMLTARRNSINKAIDEMMMIESSLHLRILKKNSQTESKPQEPSVRELQQTKVQAPPTEVEPPKETITIERQKRLASHHGCLPPSNDYLDPEEITSIRNQHIFDHEDLLNVWNKNKCSDSESTDDKLDRMAKVVAAIKRTLRCYEGNVKQICDKEKHTNKSKGLYENKNHSQLLQELEEEKQANKQLRQRNEQLAEQIARLRSSLDGRPLAIAEFSGQHVETLFTNDQFRIVKVQAPVKQTRHASLERARSAPEASLPSILKYVFLLQEKIVDGLPLTEASSRNCKPEPTLLTKQTNAIPKEVIKTPSPPIRKHVPVEPPAAKQVAQSNELYRPQHVTPIASEETPDLRQLGVKLEEIRKQRKKIFEDDIWNEIENIKL